MKRTLLLTVGLPRSGKSTWARMRGLPTVCPDEIRRAMGCFPFVAQMEPMVWFIAKIMVTALFASGANQVVLDATNITKKRRHEWASHQWDVECVFFPTCEALCVERARANDQGYLVGVIQRMRRAFDGFMDDEIVRDSNGRLLVDHPTEIPFTV